jgi:hypothetical protein
MNTYEQDNVVRVSVTFKDAAGVLADPTTVKLRVKIGSAEPSEYVYGTDSEVMRDSAGLYHADLAVNAPGTWRYKWLGTGTVTAADENSFKVERANL